MKRYFYIIFLLSSLLLGKTFTNVTFTGDIDMISGEFDRATLLKICHIEYPAVYKIWKSDPTFEDNEVEDFVDNLKRYAKSMGYYKSRVNAKMDDDTIYLNIQKKQPIKVTSIEMDGEFEHFALFSKGERFRTTDFTGTKKAIVAYLEENGYPTYKLNAKAYVDIDLYKVDVKISVDKGEKRYFSITDINNSSKVDNELILNEIVYEQDELYNILKLEESYENIYRLGVFEKIKMEADFNNSNGKSPIHLSLVEGKTKEFSSNLGYDTVEGARGGVEYIDHNFFGNLREFKASLKLSEKGYTAYTGFYDPRVKIVPLMGRMSFRNELFYSKYDYESYIEKLLTERVTFGKSFIGLDHYFGFQMESSEIESEISEFTSGNYQINSLFYRLVIDGRDSTMDAKNGYYTSLYVERAMKAIGSEMDYTKVLAEARYIKEFEPMVFAVKATAGTISQKTPPFKHFFLGGSMSNRGYDYRDLGEHSEGGYPLGGLSVLDGSFEGRYYLTDDFSVVGFLDASKISNKVNDFDGEWYKSYGLGMRYLSIIGPLRLDVGHPSDGEGYVLHLGIGQVF